MRDKLPQEEKPADMVFPFQGFLVNGILNLQGQRINDATVIQLIDFLRQNPSLTITTLNLQNNFISDEGARELAAFLWNNASLQMLNLRDNTIGDSGAQTLVAALQYRSTKGVSPLELDVNDNAITEKYLVSLRKLAIPINYGLQNSNPQLASPRSAVLESKETSLAASNNHAAT